VLRRDRLLTSEGFGPFSHPTSLFCAVGNADKLLRPKRITTPFLLPIGGPPFLTHAMPCRPLALNVLLHLPNCVTLTLGGSYNVNLLAPLAATTTSTATTVAPVRVSGGGERVAGAEVFRHCGLLATHNPGQEGLSEPGGALLEARIPSGGKGSCL